MLDEALDLFLGCRCVGCDRPGRMLCPACRSALSVRAAPAWPTPVPAGLVPPFATETYEYPLLDGVPADARAGKGGSLRQHFLSDENLARIRGLDAIAKRRGQSLAQMAIAWALRDPRVTSALIGARNVEQLENSLAALGNLHFSEEELNGIDSYAQEGGIDLWSRSSSVTADEIA